jgi:aryl-alcohol dehydrogenase-like predicted oxidoreductase
MQQHQLGHSGLYVSELALGTMTFGMPGWGCDEETSISLVHRYLDGGGTFIDTADGYLQSEEICGRALRGRRDGVVVATKFGIPVGAGPHERGTGRLHIKRACEQSLRRLQTDYLDLYQLHMDDPATPLEETITALDDLVHEGKVLYVGASNMLAYRLMKALSISDARQATRFVSFQGQYNLIVRTLEREHFRLTHEERLGFLSWSPLAAGMLTGKVTRDSGGHSDTRLAQRGTDLDALQKNDHGFTVADVVTQAATEIGCTPAQLALAWQRTKPVTSVILGVRTTEQLDDNLAALDVVIPPEIEERLEDVSRLPDEYPGTFIDVFAGWIRGTSGGVTGSVTKGSVRSS